MSEAVKVSDVERFWSKVGPRRKGACWMWTAGCFTHGYGAFHVGSKKTGKRHHAHRWIYEQVVGPIPDGLQLDHICHNVDPTCRGGRNCLHRKCVNPEHLEPVTGAVNANRSPNSTAQRTHCPAGHPYDEANTRVYQGRRYCRQCRRERSALYIDRWRAKGGKYKWEQSVEAWAEHQAYKREWARERRRKDSA